LELDSFWDLFEGHLIGLSYADNTVVAYRRDVLQFFAFLQERDLSLEGVTSVHVSEYLAWLAGNGIAASSRALSSCLTVNK